MVRGGQTVGGGAPSMDFSNLQQGIQFALQLKEMKRQFNVDSWFEQMKWQAENYTGGEQKFFEDNPDFMKKGLSHFAGGGRKGRARADTMYDQLLRGEQSVDEISEELAAAIATRKIVATEKVAPGLVPSVMGKEPPQETVKETVSKDAEGGETVTTERVQVGEKIEYPDEFRTIPGGEIEIPGRAEPRAIGRGLVKPTAPSGYAQRAPTQVTQAPGKPAGPPTEGALGRTIDDYVMPVFQKYGVGNQQDFNKKLEDPKLDADTKAQMMREWTEARNAYFDRGTLRSQAAAAAEAPKAAVTPRGETRKVTIPPGEVPPTPPIRTPIYEERRVESAVAKTDIPSGMKERVATTLDSLSPNKQLEDVPEGEKQMVKQVGDKMVTEWAAAPGQDSEKLKDLVGYVNFLQEHSKAESVADNPIVADMIFSQAKHLDRTIRIDEANVALRAAEFKAANPGPEDPGYARWVREVELLDKELNIRAAEGDIALLTLGIREMELEIQRFALMNPDAVGMSEEQIKTFIEEEKFFNNLRMTILKEKGGHIKRTNNAWVEMLERDPNLRARFEDYENVRNNLVWGTFGGGAAAEEEEYTVEEAQALAEAGYDRRQLELEGYPKEILDQIF